MQDGEGAGRRRLCRQASARGRAGLRDIGSRGVLRRLRTPHRYACPHVFQICRHGGVAGRGCSRPVQGPLEMVVGRQGDTAEENSMPQAQKYVKPCTQPRRLHQLTIPDCKAGNRGCLFHSSFESYARFVRCGAIEYQEHVPPPSPHSFGPEILLQIICLATINLFRNPMLWCSSLLSEIGFQRNTVSAGSLNCGCLEPEKESSTTCFCAGNGGDQDMVLTR